MSKMAKIAIFQVFGGFGDPPGDPLRGCMGMYIPMCMPRRAYMGPPGYMVYPEAHIVLVPVQNGLPNGAISERQA